MSSNRSGVLHLGGRRSSCRTRRRDPPWLSDADAPAWQVGRELLARRARLELDVLLLRERDSGLVAARVPWSWTIICANPRTRASLALASASLAWAISPVFATCVTSRICPSDIDGADCGSMVPPLLPVSLPAFGPSRGTLGGRFGPLLLHGRSVGRLGRGCRGSPRRAEAAAELRPSARWARGHMP